MGRQRTALPNSSSKFKKVAHYSSKSKCLICKGQYSPFSVDMCCVRAMCAKNSAVNCDGDIKIKSVQILNGAWLGPSRQA